MLVPTRRLLSIRRCARRPLGVSLLVWRARRGAGFQACGSGRPVCQTSRSLPQSVERRPRRPLVGAGRRTTSPRLAGGSRSRRLSAVASKLLCALRVRRRLGGVRPRAVRAASTARRLAQRAVGCAASSRPRRRVLRRRRHGRLLAAPHDDRTGRGRCWRADDAYRGCNACRAPPLAREAALGAVLQPLIEVSGVARALAMNASPQPLRHAAGTAATGRVARLSTKINSVRSTPSSRFPLLLRSLGGLAEDQSGLLKPAG